MSDGWLTIKSVEEVCAMTGLAGGFCAGTGFDEQRKRDGDRNIAR